MTQNNEANINWDVEFKRHLQILRPYLEQQLDEDVIEICNSWIKRLSGCKETEKPLRNKYVFVLSYQLARGILDEPFLKTPSAGDLPPLDDDINSDDSWTEVEYLVIDSDNKNSKVLCESRHPSQSYIDNSGVASNLHKEASCMDTKSGLHNFNDDNEDITKRGPAIFCYDCPQVTGHFTNCNEGEESYQYRANNLVMKLREIKQENVLLHNELVALKKESQRRRNDESLDDSILKVHTSTSTSIYNQASSTTIISLKCKLQQQSRNTLIETVARLQDQIDNYNEMKRHEIEELDAKHKLEIIKVKTNVREEIKSAYENNSNELKKQYESVIIEMQHNAREEIESFISKKEHLVIEKDKLLQSKDIEISNLKCQLDELKSNQFTVLNKFLDRSNENSTDSVRVKAQELQKRLHKMEKTKNRYARVYEAKISSLQREKHLAECSLQLQLVKQRAQLVNEMSEENQLELAIALAKLENKYKQIVANVQATAVQRRLQDQAALESIIQAVSGPRVPNETLNVNANAAKTMRNQTKDAGQRRDREYRTNSASNTVGNTSARHKSFGEDSIVTGYCLDSEKLGELFERMHIPQRDVVESPK